MPDSITVASFVFGLVLLIAALIGKELKIAAVEMPALNRLQRWVVGMIGIFLVVFGLTEGQVLRLPSASPASGAVRQTAGAAVPQSAQAATDCFGEVPEADRIQVGIEKQRRTDRSFNTGQPREGVLVIQLSRDGAVLGSIQFATHQSGVGFDILNVVDAACNPISTFENASRPDQPRESPYNYDTLQYHFGDTAIALTLAYGEGSGKIQLNAMEISTGSQ